MRKRLPPRPDFPPSLANEAAWPSAADFHAARFRYAVDHLGHLDPVSLLRTAHEARRAEMRGAALAETAQLL